jgi:pleiotropic regulator 1
MEWVLTMVLVLQAHLPSQNGNTEPSPLRSTGLAFETNNKWFASSAGDRDIKIGDIATDSLRFTLAGHNSTVRGLAVTPRRPDLSSCGEDKMVKFCDLETNKVIRHYHGHLGGVCTLALHPCLAYFTE